MCDHVYHLVALVCVQDTSVEDMRYPYSFTLHPPVRRVEPTSECTKGGKRGAGGRGRRGKHEEEGEKVWKDGAEGEGKERREEERRKGEGVGGEEGEGREVGVGEREVEGGGFD